MERELRCVSLENRRGCLIIDTDGTEVMRLEWRDGDWQVMTAACETPLNWKDMLRVMDVFRAHIVRCQRTKMS